MSNRCLWTGAGALLLTACLAVSAVPAMARVPSPPAGAQPAGLPTRTALAWPRDLESAGEHIALYQPDVETWNGDRIAGRAAMALRGKDGPSTYGVAHFSARADIDKPSGLVQLSDIRIERETVRVYVPLVSMLLISLVLSLVLHLARRLL